MLVGMTKVFVAALHFDVLVAGRANATPDAQSANSMEVNFIVAGEVFKEREWAGCEYAGDEKTGTTA